MSDQSLIAPRYHLAVLRLWEERSDGERLWRFSLEDARTSERHGFKNLESLMAFLENWTRDPAAGHSLRNNPDTLQP